MENTEDAGNNTSANRITWSKDGKKDRGKEAHGTQREKLITSLPEAGTKRRNPIDRASAQDIS